MSLHARDNGADEVNIKYRIEVYQMKDDRDGKKASALEASHCFSNAHESCGDEGPKALRRRRRRGRTKFAMQYGVCHMEKNYAAKAERFRCQGADYATCKLPLSSCEAGQYEYSVLEIP